MHDQRFDEGIKQSQIGLVVFWGEVFEFLDRFGEVGVVGGCEGVVVGVGVAGVREDGHVDGVVEGDVVLGVVGEPLEGVEEGTVGDLVNVRARVADIADAVAILKGEGFTLGGKTLCGGAG